MPQDDEQINMIAAIRESEADSRMTGAERGTVNRVAAKDTLTRGDDTALRQVWDRVVFPFLSGG
jgi:hypothetical protein